MKDLVKEVHDKARKENVPIMKDDGMKFLCALLEEHKEVRDILEIGTAVGYSAINMARIRWDMTIDTLEVNPDMYAQACHNVDAASYVTTKQYDLVFVDAAKSQYRRYLEHFYKNTHKGTIFVFDNLNFHGIVDDGSLSHNRSTIQMIHKIKKFRDHIIHDPRFHTVFYGDVGDGVAVSIRIDDETEA